MNEDLIKKIVASKHADYEANLTIWEKNEALFNGSRQVFDYLKKFVWEINDDALYAERQEEAVYVEFPAIMVDKFTGTLSEEVPVPNFGTLGGITEEGAVAKLIYDNTDGVGTDARNWDQFWFEALGQASTTDYRWILTEMPAEQPATQADVLSGARPYAIAISPLEVPNWNFSKGTLNWAYIKSEVDNTSVIDGEFVSETKTIFYLLVRAGYLGLGEELSVGGWWIVDADGVVQQTPDGEELTGDWTTTGGTIPMCRLFYEKRRDGKRARGIEHIGRLSLQYMNLLSASFNDAFESGSRQKYLLGVSTTQWAVIVEKSLAGTKLVPIPAEEGVTVSIHDSGQISAHEPIQKALAETLQLILKFVVRELNTSPDASGKAKQIEMLQGNSPRLSHMARNLEEAQTQTIRFMEQRAGNATPTGNVEWARRYDLRSAMDKIKTTLEIMDLGGAQSPTLVADLLLRAVEESGLGIRPTEGKTPEEATEEVRAEFLTSLSEATRSGRLGNELGL